MLSGIPINVDRRLQPALQTDPKGGNAPRLSRDGRKPSPLGRQIEIVELGPVRLRYQPGPQYSGSQLKGTCRGPKIRNRTFEEREGGARLLFSRARAGTAKGLVATS